jgi:muconate cycloisomerase
MRSRNYVIVKIHTDEGIVGIAEASTIDTWGEPQVAAVSAIEKILGPVLEGESPFNIRSILYKMDRALEYFWYSKAAIDTALYDILGKALDIPLYKLIGGQYREKVTTSRSVGITDIDDAVQWARRLYEEFGSQTIKVKVGIDVKNDIEIVKRIRKEVGDDVLLKVDANQGYDDAKTAITALTAMDSYDVRIAEQPIKANDLKGMAQVVHTVRAHVAADESVWSPSDVIRIFEQKAADVLTIYIAKAGGITRNLEVAAVAKACNLPCILGGMGEMGVGSAANVHFAAAVENLKFPGDLHLPPFLLMDDIIKEPIEYRKDEIVVPQKPGLGVELDEKKMSKYKTE